MSKLIDLTNQKFGRLIVLENTTARKELIDALKEYNPKLYTESLEYLEIKEDSI